MCGSFDVGRHRRDTYSPTEDKHFVLTLITDVETHRLERTVCDGDLQRKLREAASRNSLSHIFFFFQTLWNLFLLCVCVCVSLHRHIPIRIGLCVCVCMTMGVVCEKRMQSVTGIHPFPPLVSECL